MRDDIEQKYVISRPDASQVDMSALEGAAAAPAAPPIEGLDEIRRAAEIGAEVAAEVEAPPEFDLAAVEARNVKLILGLLGQLIDSQFGPIARIRVENLDPEEARRLLLKALPSGSTLSLSDPALGEKIDAGLTPQMQEDLRLPLERIMENAFVDPVAIHRGATVFDMHAHPGLKAQWFQQDLSLDHFAQSPVEKLLGTSPFAFDPFSVRTSFPKLRRGGVNVTFSTIYALEKETLFDMRILRGVPMPTFLSNQIVGLFKRLPWLIAALAFAIAGVGGYFAFRLLAAFATTFTVILGVVLAVVALVALVAGVGLLVLHLRWILPVLIKLVVESEYFDATQSSIERVENQAERSDGVRVAHSVEELEAGLREINAAKRAHHNGDGAAPQPLVLIHALEGAHCLQGPLASERLAEVKRAANLGQDIAALDDALQHDQAVEDEVMANLMTLYRSGVAMIGLAHYYPNIVCQSVFSYPERAVNMIDPRRWEHNWHDVTLGLTRIGTRVVQEMLRLGMIVDVTHTSPTTRRDIYDLVDDWDDGNGKQYAVAASHIGVQGVHRHPYNLADWEIEWLAEHHGVIGVMWSIFWLCGHEGLKIGLGYVTRSIDHILNLLGDEGSRVIGFGSDLDGFSDPPDDLWDARRWPVLTQFLAAECRLDEQGHTLRKYTTEQLRAFVGGNILWQVQNGWGRRVADDKHDLIAQLGSINNRLAVEAADGLRSGGWLTDGSLRGASLRAANLRGANLSDADLRGVDLREADLREAHVGGVQIDEETILPDGRYGWAGIDIAAYTV